MDMQWGADGSFYLLTYGDGFFNINADAGMYRWDYVKGQRAPKAVLTTDKTDGPLPLTVNFSSAGSLDEDPGDSIRYEWDFGDGSPLSLEANPQHVYTKAGRYTAVLSVIDSLGQEDVDEHGHHGGQHQPDRGRHRAARRWPVLLRRQDPVQGHGHRSGGSVDQLQRRHVTFVLGHDTHGHAERARRAAPGSCRPMPATSPMAATCSASSAPATPTRVAGRQRGGSVAVDDEPDPDPPEASGGRVRRQPVRYGHGGQHRRPRHRRASRQPGAPATGCS